jgi:hypothetical protein
MGSNLLIEAVDAVIWRSIEIAFSNLPAVLGPLSPQITASLDVLSAGIALCGVALELCMLASRQRAKDVK